LEFSASVGFIHKESVTMHVHTFLRRVLLFLGTFNATYSTVLVTQSSRTWKGQNWKGWRKSYKIRKLSKS